MSSTESKPASEQSVKRGPNEEKIGTAQDNVTKGYGSSGKASIISGKPDGDRQGGPGSNNDQAETPLKAR